MIGNCSWRIGYIYIYIVSGDGTVTEEEFLALTIARELGRVFVGVDVANGRDKTVISKVSKEELRLRESLKTLEKKYKELHHFLQFVENHKNHELKIHSYTKEDGKGVEFEGQYEVFGMKSLVEYLVDTVMEDIKTTKEMLIPFDLNAGGNIYGK